jgi:hypothetical protein
MISGGVATLSDVFDVRYRNPSRPFDRIAP